MQVFPIYAEDYNSNNQSSAQMIQLPQQKKVYPLKNNSQSKTTRNINAANPPSTESRAYFSRTDSHPKLSFISQQSRSFSFHKNLKAEFKTMTRKLIHAIGFIKELKSYSEQLKSEHQQYQFRKRDILPFYPDEIGYNIWNQLMKVLHFAASILFPLHLAFEFEGYTNILRILLVATFYLDIIFNFLSCHVDGEHNLKHLWADIITYYIKNWFFLDFVSLLPYEYMNFPELFRLLALIRVFKFFVYQKKIDFKSAKDIIKKKEDIISEDLHYRSNYFWSLMRMQKLITMFFDILLLTHLFACLWYWAARYQNFSSDTWIQRYKYYEVDLISVYVECLNWSFQTITVIGYGTVSARTFIEYFIQNLWMLVGVGFYSFTIGNLTFLLMQNNPNQEQEEQIRQLENLVDLMNIPDEIFHEIKSYIAHNSKINPFWLSQSKDIMRVIPLSLALYVLVAVHKDIFTSIPFFVNDINFALNVLPYCVFQKLEPFETIYHIGQSANDFYFLINGDVRLTDHSGQCILRVMEGTAFGEIESLEQTLRKWHAHAITKSLIMICPGKQFFDHLSVDSPQYFELEQMYKRRVLLLKDYMIQKKQQLYRVKRSTAIIAGDKIVKYGTKRTKQDRQRKNKELMKNIDCRTYASLQQDLLLQVIGQRKERRQLLRQKFKNAVDRIKKLVNRTKRRGALTEDPDYILIRNLVLNRLNTKQQYTQNEVLFSAPEVGKRMLQNFRMVCEKENDVQSFLIKVKQESTARMKKIKLKDIVEKYKLNKYVRQSSIKRQQEIIHEQGWLQQYIKNEIDNEKKEIVRRKSFKVLFLTNLSKNRNRLTKISENFKQIFLLSTSVSMQKFQIVQYEKDIDDIITDCQMLFQNIF